MARIGFVILNHTSAMISAITFSKSLVKAGHQVTIIGNNNSCKQAKANGVDARALGDFTERSAPTGFPVAYHDKFRYWFPPHLDYIHQQNLVLSKMTTIISQGDFDMAIIDTMVLFPYIIATFKVNIPVVRFTPNLSGASYPYYPAISSTLAPLDQNILYKFKALITRCQRYASVIPTLFINKIYALFSYKNRPYNDWQKQIKKQGLKLRLFEYGLTITDLAELVAAPSGFDFPALLDINPRRNFIGACVNTERDQYEDEILRDFDDKPLIYCALGTFSKRYGHAKQIFETLIQFAKDNDAYNYLIQYGDVAIASETLPAHIRMKPFVPQIEVLRKASMMITHGGLGSVREASYYGVPMLVIPGWNDQYGNAARVNFHGTGYLIKPRQFTKTLLSELIPQLLKDPDIQKKVNQMKAIFQKESDASPGIVMINKILENSP